MIRFVALSALWFLLGPVSAQADADPGPIPDMADVALLRDCLSNQPVETALSCRLRVFTPCADASDEDPSALRLCHLNEADAWDFIRIEDSWPRAVAAARQRDEHESRHESGQVGLEAALRATRPVWLAHRDATCALARLGPTDFRRGAVDGSACWSRLTAQRVLDLNLWRQRWSEGE